MGTVFLTVSASNAESALSELERLAEKHFFEAGGIAEDDVDTSLAVTDELRLARHVLRLHLFNSVPTLRYYLGDWYLWDGRWRQLEPQQFIDLIYRLCKRYLIASTVEAKRAPAFGKAAAANVEMALKSLTSFRGPGWIDGRGGRWLAFADSILNLDKWAAGVVECVPQTPGFFAPHALAYPLKYTEAEPTILLAMLREQHNESEIAAFQEFGGFAMTPDTRFQRILVQIGPPRSGKGLKERTCRTTAGEHNVASKTLESFVSPHAMEDLPGKTLLAISDSRPDSKLSKRAVERLLSISGGDPQNINPKGRAHYTTPLTCKLMLTSNIVPDFDDPTGALLSRFLFVETRKSFAGQEDPQLLDKILTQQNEIAWWFLRGLQRLLQNGRYTEPDNNLKVQFQAQNAPVQCFVASRCELSGGIGKEALHDAFLAWCEESQVSPLEREEFFRQLYASYKAIRAVRPRQGDARVNAVEGISLKGATA